MLPDDPLPTATSKPATLGFTALREGIRRHYSAIQGLEIEYTQRNRSLSSTDPKDNQDIRLHFAMKGEQRLKSRFRSLPTSEEIEETWAFHEGRQQTYLSALQEATIKPTKEPFVDMDAYVHALGIPTQDADRASVSKSNYFLPQVLN